MKSFFPVALLILFPAFAVAQGDEALPQDSMEKLREKISRLEKERDALKKDVDSYREQLLESARRIFELRQRLKNGTPPARTEEKTEPAPETVLNPEKVETGPEVPIRAKVQFVDRTEGFFLLDKGEEAGIKPGYRFEVVRTVYKAGQEEPETVHIGIAEVEKLLGKKKDHAKLKLIEGDILKIRYDDIAIAYRKEREIPLEKKTGEGWKPPRFKVVGVTNDIYMISYGGMHGARATQVVYIYRDRKLVVKLRIESVEKDYGIARVIRGSQKGKFGPGDTIEIEKRRSLVVGRLIHLDDRTGIWIDVGSNDGAKQGMKIAVMRRGKKVGELVLEKVERFWSTALLTGETGLGDLKMKDYVEEIPEETGKK
jgi:hypothetical protein